jgi:hypothetical protein
MEPDEIEELTPEPEPEEPDEAEEEPFLERRFGERPYLVYAALAAGALVLLILLMIVWLSTNDGDGDQPLCLDLSVDDAQSAILSGKVKRADVLLDEDQPMHGLTAIQLELEEGECRKLPEGADNRNALYQILGLIELYNQEGEGNVRVEYLRQQVPPELLWTATSTPTQAIQTPTVSPAAAATPLPVRPTSTPAASTPQVSPSPPPS